MPMWSLYVRRRVAKNVTMTDDKPKTGLAAWLDKSQGGPSFTFVRMDGDDAIWQVEAPGQEPYFASVAPFSEVIVVGSSPEVADDDATCEKHETEAVQ